jgi:hypothetical protein
VGKKRHFSMIILAHPVAFCLHVPRDVSLYHHFHFFLVCDFSIQFFIVFHIGRIRQSDAGCNFQLAGGD